jgi:hypothetical protein
MRHACLWVVAVIWASTLSACSLLHKGGPAADAGQDAETAPVPDEDVSAPPALVDAGVSGRPYGLGRPHASSGCAGNLVPVVLTPGTPAECVLECVSDPSCPEGMACSARGSLWENGKEGKKVSFCAIGPRGNGKADAGAPAVRTVDAGAAPPAKRLDVRKSAAGACPAGYAVCGAACRLTCKSTAECGLATAHCTGGFCEGPGALPCK